MFHDYSNTFDSSYIHYLCLLWNPLLVAVHDCSLCEYPLRGGALEFSLAINLGRELRCVLNRKVRRYSVCHVQ